MYVSLFFFVTSTIIHQTLAAESILNNGPSEKRTPMGFQGMRGKKFVTTNLDDNELSKRVPMGFQSTRGKKDPINVNFDDDEYNYEKHGYEGMPSKKNDYLASEPDDSLYYNEYEKRAPMGFQGMRGKKTMLLEDEIYKRAMMGFQGMRGKKSFDEMLDEIDKKSDYYGLPKVSYINDYPDEYGKRALAMGFQGTRGKKSEYENYQGDKRAGSSMGFYGTRGKKSFLEELDDMEKRASMGFQGMRGKKAVDNYYYDYMNDPSTYEKRAPMGFQGMRGKKESMGFVGMRGKRNIADVYDLNDSYHDRPKDMQESRFNSNGIQFNKRAQYGFFGTRGKKIPRWEIRGKFVGVRGKKWSPDLDNANNLMANRLGSGEQIDIKSDTSPKFNTQ